MRRLAQPARPLTTRRVTYRRRSAARKAAHRRAGTRPALLTQAEPPAPHCIELCSGANTHALPWQHPFGQFCALHEPRKIGGEPADALLAGRARETNVARGAAGAARRRLLQGASMHTPFEQQRVRHVPGLQPAGTGRTAAPRLPSSPPCTESTAARRCHIRHRSSARPRGTYYPGGSQADTSPGCTKACLTKATHLGEIWHVLPGAHWLRSAPVRTPARAWNAGNMHVLPWQQPVWTRHGVARARARVGGERGAHEPPSMLSMRSHPARKAAGAAASAAALHRFIAPPGGTHVSPTQQPNEHVIALQPAGARVARVAREAGAALRGRRLPLSAAAGSRSARADSRRCRLAAGGAILRAARRRQRLAESTGRHRLADELRRAHAAGVAERAAAHHALADRWATGATPFWQRPFRAGRRLARSPASNAGAQLPRTAAACRRLTGRCCRCCRRRRRPIASCCAGPMQVLPRQHPNGQFCEFYAPASGAALQKPPIGFVWQSAPGARFAAEAPPVPHDIRALRERRQTRRPETAAGGAVRRDAVPGSALPSFGVSAEVEGTGRAGAAPSPAPRRMVL